MIYESIYDLLLTYVFGGVAITPNIELVLILISTIACLFVIALPFWIVLRIIKLMLVD